MFSILYLFYLCVWCALLCLALIWWIGLLQQKEYRWDRLLAHLRSLSPVQFLVLLVPAVTSLRPKLFKRPVKTSRALILLVLSLLVLLYCFFAALSWSKAVAVLEQSRLLVLPFLLYISAPVVVLGFATLTSCAVWLITQWYLFDIGRRFRAQKILVIGITGSFGKTTTKQLLAHVLSDQGKICTTPGSVNTALGIARFLQKNLTGVETLILEYAAYKTGEIARIAAVIPPNLAILTGLGKQHLELFGSKERIATAKAELLEALPKNARVFCANDSALEIVAAAKNKQTLEIEKTWLLPDLQVKTAILGEHYNNTIKVVVAVAHHLGLPEKEILPKLQSFAPSEKWIQKRTTKSGAQVLDDSGTSNPDGFLAALKLLSEQTEPRKILVTAGIVDLGSESQSIHTGLARAATPHVAEVWYLGEIGRKEFVATFGGKVFSDREKVLQRAQTLDSKTCILLEGRMPLWFSKEL